MNGERIVTDITANDGFWHSVCVMWHSSNGEWSIYIDAKLGDNGTGLANGTFIPGKKNHLELLTGGVIFIFYFITPFLES